MENLPIPPICASFSIITFGPSCYTFGCDPILIWPVSFEQFDDEFPKSRGKKYFF